MNRPAETEFLEFFRELDALLPLEKPSCKATLYLFGGAVSVIAYGSRRATLDIDAYIEDRALRGKLLKWAGSGSELEKRHGLYLHAANTELMLLETPEWKERSVQILCGKLRNIRLMAISPEDLVLSKLSRYNDRDREDIRFLITKHRLKAGKLIGYYKSARKYFVGDLCALDLTFNIILKEYFGLQAHKFD
ncbi:MAG: hypothetical protein A2089_11265 [Elusimicrobia bacterium GWD2_63_28]|nr:MAG: hypothetical protein A2089_11265 [Elusimicrobia bacterium GWD2_63_28]